MKIPPHLNPLSFGERKKQRGKIEYELLNRADRAIRRYSETD
jgi:hypothetical protein